MNDLPISDFVINKVTGANRVKALPNLVTERKNRDLWALAIKREGTTEYKSKAGLSLSDNRHAVLLPKGSDYEWKCTLGECLIVQFDADFNYPVPLSISIHDSAELISKFNKIEKILYSNSPVKQWAAISLLYEMLLYLFSQSKSSYSVNSKEKILEPVLDFIRNEYADSDITNDRLALVAGISTVYLRKLFNGIHGCGPMEYLNRFRMQKAASLLSTDYNSVSAIAESVGYNSIYHFSRMFKKYYGVSPTKFKPETNSYQNT